MSRTSSQERAATDPATVMNHVTKPPTSQLSVSAKPRLSSSATPLLPRDSSTHVLAPPLDEMEELAREFSRMDRVLRDSEQRWHCPEPLIDCACQTEDFLLLPYFRRRHVTSRGDGGRAALSHQLSYPFISAENLLHPGHRELRKQSTISCDTGDLLRREISPRPRLRVSHSSSHSTISPQPSFGSDSRSGSEIQPLIITSPARVSSIMSSPMISVRTRTRSTSSESLSECEACGDSVEALLEVAGQEYSSPPSLSGPEDLPPRTPRHEAIHRQRAISSDIDSPLKSSSSSHESYPHRGRPLPKRSAVPSIRVEAASPAPDSGPRRPSVQWSSGVDTWNSSGDTVSVFSEYEMPGELRRSPKRPPSHPRWVSLEMEGTKRINTLTQPRKKSAKHDGELVPRRTRIGYNESVKSSEV